MSDRDALMAAVVAEPDADAPRLVYADWLEENPRNVADTARAQFIRLEIEAETMPNDSLEKSELKRQAAVLFNKHYQSWNADTPRWNEWYDSSLVYRRGFPYELRTVFRKLAYGDHELFERLPIQSLSLGSRSGHVHYRGQQVMTTITTRLRGEHQALRTFWTPQLSAVHQKSPLDLSRIQVLKIEPNLNLDSHHGSQGIDNGEAVFRMITEHPTLRNLQSLSWASHGLADVCMLPLERALTTAVFANGLQQLDLSDNNITDAGASILLSVRSLDRLQELILTGNPISPRTVQLLRNRLGNRLVMKRRTIIG
jgi:uncharacterized protein (TIGR02996 family)